MAEAVILSAVRTPIGRYGGALSDVRPDDLAARVIKEAVQRAGVPPAEIEDVYFGAANQAGEDNRNVARRDLGDDMLHDLSEVLRASIAAGLESREEALSYALQYGRGLDRRLADRFVGMYVNRLTEDYGDEGREAVGELLRRGEQIGAFEQPVRVDFVS